MTDETENPADPLACTRCRELITADRPLAKRRRWCRPCESQRVRDSEARRRDRMGADEYREHHRLKMQRWRSGVRA